MIEVYKYGGNLLNDKNNRSKIYEDLKKKKEKGIKVIMAVSAFGREKDSFSTDSLGKNIELLSPKEKDKVMTFGEIYSSLIIKNELLREGFKAGNLNYDELGIICDNNYQDGNIISADMSFLKKIIEEYDIVVIPGFVGVSSEGSIISLGRNTSDLTAVVVADCLNLKKANIIKEVDGVYKKDPKKGESKLVSFLNYDEALSLVNAGSTMFSKKTIEYAKENNVEIEIKGINKVDGSLISNKESNESILFINEEKDEIKIVFKDMGIFNKFFNLLVESKVKINNLVIVKNVVFVSGEKEKLKNFIEKFL